MEMSKQKHGMKDGLSYVLAVGNERDNESSRRHLQKKWEKRARRNTFKRETEKELKSIN